MNGQPKLPEELPCDECGLPGASEIGDGRYCADCFSLKGSSCGGGGTVESTE